jgi:hypothetical protein
MQNQGGQDEALEGELVAGGALLANGRRAGCCLVVVISFGLARFENRGRDAVQAGRVVRRHKVIIAPAVGIKAALETASADWNANCRDIQIPRDYQR